MPPAWRHCLLPLVVLACCGLMICGELKNEDLIKLNCLLKEPQTNCSDNIPTELITTGLLDIFVDINKENDQINKSINDSNVGHYLLSLPATIMALIPKTNLLNISGAVVAEIIKTHYENEALVIKYMGLLNKREQQKIFLKHISNVSLSDRLQEIIASQMASWLQLDDWTTDDFVLSRNVGSPIFAYLPPGLLVNIPGKTALTFLLHLHEWKGLHPTDEWGEKPLPVKRIWSYLFVRELFPQLLEVWATHNLKLDSYFLQGATSDEISHLNLKGVNNLNVINGIDLNKIQVRAIFENLYGNYSTHSLRNFNDIAKYIPFLTPQQLQKFAVTIADGMLLPNYLPQMSLHSLPTMKQMMEYHIAKLIIDGKLENENPLSWKQNISYICQFAFLLPKGLLSQYEMQNLPIQTLSRLDSTFLSREKARLLSGTVDPEILLGLRGFLKAVPSSVLSGLKIGNLKQDILFNVVTNIAASSSLENTIKKCSMYIDIEVLTILQKIRSHLGERNLLENMVKSVGPCKFFKLLSPKELIRVENELKSILVGNSKQNFIRIAKDLPESTLSVLLGSIRRTILYNNESWTLKSFSESGVRELILGITCNDILAIQTPDILQILQLYNTYILDTEKVFPKDNQHCWLKVIPEYFNLKAKLRGHKVPKHFIEVVEREDIHAIGGFVLAGVPSKLISKAPEELNILKAVGAQSPLKLFQSMNSESPSNYSALFTKNYIETPEIQLVDLFKMGTLTNFLGKVDIVRINPKAFKIFLESIPQENKALCTSMENMNAWCQLIIKAFGEQSTWSSSSLTSLGDFLVSCPHTMLLDLPEESWMHSIDVLTETTSYHSQGEYLGELSHLTFLQTCLKFLDVTDHEEYVSSIKMLLHFYLIATQESINKIIPAAQIIKFYKREPATESTTLKFHSAFGRVSEHLSKIELLISDVTNRTKRELLPSDIHVNDDPGDDLRAAVIDSPYEFDNHNSTSHEPKSRNVPNDDISVTGEPVLQIINNITCDAIKAAGPCMSIALRPQDIENMDIHETQECIDTFGTLNLPPDVKKSVLKVLGKETLISNLVNLGHLIKVLDISDLNGLELKRSDSQYLDIISKLGEEIEDPKMIRTLATKWIIENMNVSLETEEIGALRNIICGLPTPLVTELLDRGNVFIELMSVFRNLKGCPMMCLQDIAAVAVSNYGDPSTWTSDDVSAMGVIMAGIDVNFWKLIKGTNGNSPLHGLSPQAMVCLPQNVINGLTTEQTGSLLPSVIAVMEDKLHSMSEQQKEILKQILENERGSLIQSNGAMVFQAKSAIMALALSFLI